jgi:hypothetical protein
MRRAMIRWLRAVILIGIAAALVFFLYPREPRLLDRAMKVADTKEWHGGRRFNVDTGIHWLSDEEVLFSRYEGPKKEDRVIYARNIRTGRERKLTGLTKAIEDFGGEVVDDQNVSPDGKWYLWSQRWGGCLLASVNGKRQHLYDSADDECYRSLLWMTDGYHWLENYYLNGKTKHLVLHDVRDPKTAITFPITGREELFCHLQCILSPQEMVAVAVLEPDVDDLGRAAPNSHILVYKLSLDTRAKPHAPYRIAVPRGSPDYVYAVSPRGDRIAWGVTITRGDSLMTRLHRVFRFIKPKQWQSTEIWICNLDGSGMREIGNVLEPPSEDGESPWLDLQWLPGGKCLSFEYKDALYTVPAE